MRVRGIQRSESGKTKARRTQETARKATENKVLGEKEEQGMGRKKRTCAVE